MPDKKISLVKQGMQKDKHPSQLNQQEYVSARNANLSNESGNFINISNEHSNILSSKFKAGYKVVGFKNDINSNNTYFFLTNPTTNVSEIGYIPNVQNIQNLSDVEVQCNACDYENILSQPLEEADQLESQTYLTLLSDCPDNKCLNFSVLHPIKKIEIKTEKNLKSIYFTDNLNPPRYIQLDKLDMYSYEGEEVCGDDSGIVNTCLACDKMRVFRQFKMPNLFPDTIVLGGRLLPGTYEFLVAYSDSTGNEISEYFSITNPIRIFDENNRISDGTERTNFAIKLDISGLDKSFGYYKIAVIQTNTKQETSYFIEGVHPINDNSILYTSEQDKQRIDLISLLKANIHVERWEGITQANGYLFGYGITVKKEMNLQPIANLMGAFVRWQTHIAKEDLYTNGIAGAKYQGFHRDEVYALGIRFTTNKGYTTANFPLAGRPANSTDRQPLPTNTDTDSIQYINDSCVDTGITQRWQLYNTAEVLGACELSYDVPTTTVTEDLTKTCFIPEIATAPSGTFTISLNAGDSYTNLYDFIEQNRDNCAGYPFCSYLNPSNYPQVCAPAFENCSTPVLDSQVIAVESVSNEVVTKIERQFPDEYAKLKQPHNCIIYANDIQNGGYLRDSAFEKRYMPYTYNPISGQFQFKTVYVRNYSLTNDSCLYAEDIVNIDSTSVTLIGYYHNYLGADTHAELDSDKTSLATDSDFSSAKISKSALWFKGYANSREKFILEVSKQLDSQGDDDISVGQKVRLDILPSCSQSTAVYSRIVDLSQGRQFYIEVLPGGFKITDPSNNTVETISASFIDGEFLVSIDVPTIQVNHVLQNPDETPSQDISTTRYRTAPVDGCFSIATRDVEYKQIDVSYDEIVFTKKMVYTATCQFEVPQVQACEALPFKYGKFGFVESTEGYPDNEELYNSSTLNIAETDLPSTFRDEFRAYFANGVSEGQYVLKQETNLSCQPIRHFKFPDNKVSPFMWEDKQASFVDSIIYPMGITIDERLINSFLDIAVKNELITQEERDSITGYEIVRGDRTLDKGVVAKGLMYDLMKYRENNKDIYYPNYPYNDLGSDKLNLQPGRSSGWAHPYAGLGNSNFTFHSPETDYNKLSLPNMLKVEGFMFGSSKGNFDEVRNHPRMTILGKDAKTLATTLAILEATSEIAIAAASALSNGQIWTIAVGGTSTGGGFSTGGLAISAAITIGVTQLINALVYKAGRYRYEWLNTFKNLGTPRNFASYYSSEGYYNYLKPLQEEGNMVRNLQVAKNIKPSLRLSLTNEVEGSRLDLNNADRESSVLLSTCFNCEGDSDFKILYPPEYTSYDNGDEDFNTSSRTFESESNACSSGKSPEIRKNIASMYVALKNYLPAQYGTVGSIKWLTTGYRGDLTNPSTDCVAIFGGDVFISRHSLKRKMPMFLTTAMGQADLTSFEYKFYSNIGKEPKFYLNYEIDNDGSSLGGKLFPDFDSDYKMDCLTGSNGFYVKNPSKFYLYYYGIPNFLTETEINTNYRKAKSEPWENYYPNVGDFMEWTQENIVSIKRDNKFFYDQVYSKQVTPLSYRTLPAKFNREVYEKLYDSPNGVMYSLPDNSENDLIDPWLIYRPLDFYQFPTDYGKLKELRGIETSQVLGRFENQTAIFNAVDVLVDGITPEQRALGNGGIFARRPVTFAQTDLGYAGSQSTEMVSCEYGHFFVDSKRGQVFQINSGGKGIEEISSYINGKPSGMSNWFKEHLPFKILRTIPDAEIDNPYNGLGITMGWDSRYKRVFITKRDYIPKFSSNYFSCEGRIFDISNIESIIEAKEDEGYTYNGIVDCKLNFSKETTIFNKSTDIHAFFDTSGSFDGAGLTQVRNAMQSFYNNLISSIPGYTGQYYPYNDSSERWVGYIQSVANTYGGNTSDKNVLMISFVNEADGVYHSGYFNDSLTSPEIALYDADYNSHVSFYNQFESVFAVAYPIITTGASGSGSVGTMEVGKTLIAQTMYALYGSILSSAEFDNIPQNSVFSNTEWQQLKAKVTSYSPYNNLGLSNFGWAAQYNVNDLSGTVITDSRLSDDLNSLIQGGTNTNIEVIEIDLEEVDLNDENLFEDVSWTVAYSPIYGSWISYYDFKPNYYISHNNYFQTGINTEGDEFGLWSHLLTNKSFQVFYGKKYPFGVEYPIKSDPVTKTLNSIELWTEAKRNHNDYDYAISPELTFNRSNVYNAVVNSGNLNLVPQKNNLAFVRQFPKTNADNTQDILISNVDNFKWSYDYLFNRVKTNLANQPVWLWDKSQINKTINPHAVGFGGKRVLQRLYGDYFINKLEYDKDSRYNLILKWAMNDTQV